MVLSIISSDQKTSSNQTVVKFKNDLGMNLVNPDQQNCKLKMLDLLITFSNDSGLNPSQFIGVKAYLGQDVIHPYSDYIGYALYTENSDAGNHIPQKMPTESPLLHLQNTPQGQIEFSLVDQSGDLISATNISDVKIILDFQF